MTGHTPGCCVKYGKPSEEGTVAIIEGCTCGYEAYRQQEIQKILDASYKRMASIAQSDGEAGV